MTKTFAVALFIAISSFVVGGQTQSRADLLRDLEAKRAELTQLETKFLAPSTEDTSTYAEFLAQPDTGLIRLLPREKFDWEVYQKKPILMVRGSGAYYSFTRHSHEYGFSTDIGFEHGHLGVGFAGADYGMLTKLEGARLEDLSTELPGVLFLAKYVAVATEPEARVEQRRFSGGTVINGMLYKERLPAEVGATYLLRSINFDESDVLVAFQVTRQDTDGSLIVVWKLLRNFPKPALARN